MRLTLIPLLTVIAFLAACGATPRRSVLARLEGDHILIERNVYFQHDSDVIVEGSNDLLDAIARVCEEHPEIARVHVIGHTDTNGDDAHNLELSERRANAVVRALRRRGVSQDLDARGAGETERVCFTDDDACHQRNRRVEFAVDLTATPGA